MSLKFYNILCNMYIHVKIWRRVFEYFRKPRVFTYIVVQKNCEISIANSYIKNRKRQDNEYFCDSLYVIPKTIISSQITLARCMQDSIYKGCSLKGNLCCELARVRHRALQRKPMTRKRMMTLVFPSLVFVFLPFACHRLAETSANGLPAGVIHYSDM